MSISSDRGVFAPDSAWNTQDNGEELRKVPPPRENAISSSANFGGGKRWWQNGNIAYTGPSFNRSIALCRRWSKQISGGDGQVPGVESLNVKDSPTG